MIQEIVAGTIILAAVIWSVILIRKRFFAKKKSPPHACGSNDCKQCGGINLFNKESENNK